MREKAEKSKVNGLFPPMMINERLFTIIKYLYLNPHQNRKNLINLTQKEQATTDRYIKILKDAHLIEFKGSRKIGGYYLTKKAKDRIENKL